MLLQDALAGAESEAGEGFGGIEIGRGVSEYLIFAGGEAGVRNVDDGGAVFGVGGNGEGAAPVLAHGMERVVDDLHADLEQLVGISVDEQQVLGEFGLDCDFESLPLRLREFDRGADQSIEIHGSHGRGALFGKTEEAGDQRAGAPGILPDSLRQFALFGRKRTA